MKMVVNKKQERNHVNVQTSLHMIFSWVMDLRTIFYMFLLLLFSYSAPFARIICFSYEGFLKWFFFIPPPITSCHWLNVFHSYLTSFDILAIVWFQNSFLICVNFWSHVYMWRSCFPLLIY
jgi:hypothetical protein